MYKIVENSIHCKLCGDIIISFAGEKRTCSCGACSVSGGKKKLKRYGHDWVENSCLISMD